MDIQSLLQQIQQQGGQGAPQSAPQGDPQAGGQADPMGGQGGPNLDQNPFESLLQNLPQAGQGQDQGQQPQLGPDGQPLADATEPGENPGTTEPLIGALKAIQGFISSATDKDEIAVARSITLLLTKLIQSDQMKQGQYDGQNQQLAQAQGLPSALQAAMSAAKGGGGPQAPQPPVGQ